MNNTLVKLGGKSTHHVQILKWMKSHCFRYSKRSQEAFRLLNEIASS